MEEKIIIDGELSCNNCLGKTRCKQQQKAKEQRIDAILSYITNEDNEKYIAELKNEIPAITRCDVILEKQLKRLEEKYNKMVEISKENLIKYEDLRIDNQKLIIEIENLKSQIDFEAQKQAILLQENEELKARLTPLEDSYFNGLSSIEIAGLAKKSIRITTYNRQLETVLEEIREISQFACEKSICHKNCHICSDGKILKIITEAIGE